MNYTIKPKKESCILYEISNGTLVKCGTLYSNKEYISTEQDSSYSRFKIKDPVGWVKAEDVTIINDDQKINNITQTEDVKKNNITTESDSVVDEMTQYINDGTISGAGISDTGQKYYIDSETGLQYTIDNATGKRIMTIDYDNLTYEPNLNDYPIGSDVESYLDFKQIDGIFGMPYQYSTSVDRRLKNESDEMEYGRKFSEKIMMSAPLLFMTPGRPQFMAGYSDKYKKQVAQKLYDLGVQNDDELTNTKDGRYYTFKFAYDEYYEYVNNMIQKASCLLGIGDKKFKGVPLKRYNWANYKNDNLNVYISGSEYTCFYIEAETQINESFGNSTGDSALASSINQLSDLGKEAAFLMGTGAGMELDAAIKSGMQDNLESFTNFFNKWGGNGAASVANKLFGGVSALAMGGHIAFPEIWKDSDYTQSYNVSIKLVTPDADPYSQFINIMVPYYHLLGFVLPQALGYNAYTSPFLVRASYGGGFNCEMGIITNMDVTKGPNWNQFKMPTEMTITFTIKDLYKCLFMSKETNVIPFLKNSQFVDFLANSVGVNINVPEMARTLQLYSQFAIGGTVNNAISNIQNSMNNFLSNQVSKISVLW